MKCHFVYSVPPPLHNFAARLEYRLRLYFHNLGLNVSLLANRRPSQSDLSLWPLRSPYEITKHAYTALSNKVTTYLYHLTERVCCRFGPEDIFLGHPFFPHIEGKYGVTELSVKKAPRPRISALICPLHCNLEVNTKHLNRAFLDDVNALMPNVDKLFGIMGEYWWDRWDHSPFKHWKTKMIRLDMAVDAKRFPRVKNSFNQPGKRGFLYIGNNDPVKGLDFYSNLMSRLPQYPRGWIGDGLPVFGIDKISADRKLDHEFMAHVSQTFDFFVSPSRADANPTTILESMAWGFPVVCTPQSGYYETSYRRNIYLDDLDRSVSVLKQLQYADEADLLRMANEARSVVETHYTWDRFTSTVIQHLGI